MHAARRRTSVRPIVVLLAVVAAVLACSRPAAAHGPCRCTWPAVAAPGSAVRTASGYKAIWNPAPADFAEQTTPAELASGHRADAPSHTVRQGAPRRPRRRMVIQVPRATPPGIYLVLVFDGSEGGRHTTWDYVQVPYRQAGTPASGDRAARPPAGRPGAARSTIAVFALGALGGALVVTALHARRGQ